MTVGESRAEAEAETEAELAFSAANEASRCSCCGTPLAVGDCGPDDAAVWKPRGTPNWEKSCVLRFWYLEIGQGSQQTGKDDHARELGGGRRGLRQRTLFV